ncbi:hypothetical protein PR003_g14525 [Phytophthora rubi]|nr:hypothetical protein PR003_g14525 [Phytophthora rubi]
MGKEDYVTTCTDNAISGASPADYLKYSHNALQRFSAHVDFNWTLVSLERIDILESKLRDQQDELNKIAVPKTTVQEQQEELKKM